MRRIPIPTITPELCPESGPSAMTLSCSPALAWIAGCLTIIAGFWPGSVAAQAAPRLQLHSVILSGTGPVEFRFVDDGTGATDYEVESSARVDPDAVWVVETNAVIQALGNGEYAVRIEGSEEAHEFYRVTGEGGAGPVRIGFESVGFQVREGDLAQPVIAFSAPFWGVIRYSFSGTATGDDAPGLSGAVRVYGGNSAVIPVSLGDNGAIETLKDLVLTLEPGSGYTVSPATSTVTVTIEDNDALWRGSLFFEQAVLGIQLRIEEIGGAFSAALEDDGLGILPEGEHATSILFSEDSFVATSADLSLNASESLVNLPAIQRLELSAIQGMPDQRVSRDEVRGVATLKTLYPAGPHLNLTNAGTFLLLRPPGRPRTSEVELINEL